MALPEDQVGALLEEISAEFSERHQQIRDSLSGTLRTGPRDLCRLDEETLRTEAAVDRLLFPGRVLAGIRGAVQSFHRSAPGPDGSAARRAAVHSQLARHRRRTHFLHHVSNRHHPSRIGGSRYSRPPGFLTEPRQIPNPLYEKALFGRKLVELGLTGEFTRRVMNKLGESFTLEELRAASPGRTVPAAGWNVAGRSERRRKGSGCWPDPTTRSSSSRSSSLSERILFPATPSQRNGIEDARFVRFQNDDGTLNLLRDLHRLRRQGHRAGTGGDFRLSPLSIHHAERSGRPEQRHGPLPAQDRRPLRHALPAGQREHLPDVFRQRPLLE